VGNAVKFTAAGHVLISVECENRQEHKAQFKFSVEDTGIGISDVQQARLFEKFSQADTSTTRRFGGTGLGLAISRQLTELMGGKIGMTSQPNKGSTFWFTLPLDIPAPTPSEPLHIHSRGRAGVDRGRQCRQPTRLA
jgi:two-component system, sensor histidine kinase and response regulator